MDITVAVVVVTKSREFFQAGVNVINDVRSGVFQRVSVDGDWEAAPQPPVDDPLYAEARDKAVRYLSQRKDQLILLVVQATTLERAARKLISLRERTDRGFQVGMAYVDLSAPEYHGMSVGEIDASLAEFYDRLGKASVPAFQSSFSTVVFVNGEAGRIQYQPMNFIKCVLPGNRTILQTWLLCLWMDFFEMSYANSRVKPGVARAFRRAMADVLTDFLTERAGADWLPF
ncbi:MAG: biosynthesis protein PigD, partial [Methanobacterium sp.]|nr:biosynthesis protein PigD [Methanobacterium sp.]